ncbi:MAG: ATP-binding cassette domain-containing protein, partial [Candidatus Hydrogenedentales bacterium]
DQIRTRAHPQHSLSFTVHAGEVVGIAGLVGAGRTELLETLFGITPALDGIMAVGGKAIRPHHAHEAIAAGIALVPEDRKQAGLILEMSVRDNLSLAALRNLCYAGFINFQAEKQLAADEIERLNIKTPNARRIAQLLSGGNQQKIVLGKWLALKPRLLLLDEPTRGIDVGAKSEVYRLMENLADDGVAVLFVSSELEEVLTLSDRVLVMHEGRITGELPHDALSEEAVMRLAVGGDGAES